MKKPLLAVAIALGLSACAQYPAISSLPADRQPAQASQNAGPFKGESPFLKERQMVLYFKPGNSNLTNDQLDEVREFVDSLDGIREYDVVIEGHADAVGKSVKNEELARSRAVMVQQALETAGIRPWRMHVYSYGERRQLVPTNRGISDLGNRAVIVQVKPYVESVH
jgi:outer membrane protein OmpA-like peptidoglycan-associated protein